MLLYLKKKREGSKSLPLVHWKGAPVRGNSVDISTTAPVSCVNLYRKNIVALITTDLLSAV